MSVTPVNVKINYEFRMVQSMLTTDGYFYAFHVFLGGTTHALPPQPRFYIYDSHSVNNKQGNTIFSISGYIVQLSFL